jgi:flagellin-like hook-associated protein FlgL
LNPGINTKDLVVALNGNTKFSELFHATGMLSGGVNAVSIGTIDFNRDVTQHAGITQGGYRINSPGGTGTSSGIWMTGQSDSNERLILEATEYGSDHFVNVSVVEGSFDTYCPLGNRLDKLAGKDAVATINGQRAASQGNVISASQFAFQGSMDISGMQVGAYSTFTITGGGAVFQLGPDVVSTQQIRVGIPNVSTGSLGGASGKIYQLKSGGIADMRTNTKLADKIVQEAISSISITRGRIGAVQRSTLDPNIQALQDNLEALTAAEADISNADFAEESSNMARYQILVQSAATVLAQANQLPQYAATLVG